MRTVFKSALHVNAFQSIQSKSHWNQLFLAGCIHLERHSWWINEGKWHGKLWKTAVHAMTRCTTLPWYFDWIHFTGSAWIFCEKLLNKNVEWFWHRNFLTSPEFQQFLCKIYEMIKSWKILITCMYKRVCARRGLTQPSDKAWMNGKWSRNNELLHFTKLNEHVKYMRFTLISR